MSDRCFVLPELTLEEKASLCLGLGLLAHRRRSSGSASRRSWCPTARTGCAGSRTRATTSASAAACRRPASRPPRRSARPGTPTWSRRVGEALGREARAQDVAVVLGPGINIKRSPLCGRNFEYFSEDPLAVRRARRGAGRGRAEPGRRHLAEALRGQQPGDRPAAGQRRGRRADAARDLPARVRARRHRGAAVDGDVRLQQGSTAPTPPSTTGCSPRCCATSGASTAWSSPTGARCTTGSRRSRRAWTWRCRRTSGSATPRSSRRCAPATLDEAVLDTAVRARAGAGRPRHCRRAARTSRVDVGRAPRAGPASPRRSARSC